MMYKYKGKLLLSLCLLLLFSCESKSLYRHKSTPSCSNLTLNMGLVFPTESVLLYINDELILKEQIDSLDGYYFNRSFCLKYKYMDSLRLVTKYKNEIHIDETFLVTNPKMGYQISSSYPHPKNWRELFKEESFMDSIENGWGYLSIDSSVRLINFNIDTIFREPMDSVRMDLFRESMRER